ncbi:MAG: CRISPR-associated endonuclease Cas3'', partial [Bacteroidota bacterium]
MRKLLAKSADRGLLYLEEHTLHVVQAVEFFAAAYGVPLDVARNGAILHDLGKGHPTFQAMLIHKDTSQQEQWLQQLAGGEAIRQALRCRDLGKIPIHRHEYSSLAFLPLFPREQWPLLIDMVVAHHKSIVGDKSGRGLLDLLDGGDDEIFIEDHLEYFDDWAPAAEEVANHFGVPLVGMDRAMAEQALDFVLEYVDALPNDWSPARGLLMTADHFASNYKYETPKKTAELFKIPNTT